MERMKERMKENSNKRYSFVVDKTNLAWPSPSENYSWYRMKSEIKSSFLETLEDKQSMNVIDFGCGEGTDIFTLNLLVPPKKKVSFTGLDFSKVAVDFANEAAKKRGMNNCKFVVGDADSGRFTKKKFDLLISSEVLEHTDDPLVYLKNANAQLKISGNIIITTPNQSHLFKKMFRFFPEKFKKNFKKEQDWCFERHGTDTSNLFDSHISTQTYKQLRELFKISGFEIIRTVRSPLIYGGNWIDKRPWLFSILLFLDGILPRSFFINLGWDLIIFAKKVEERKK